MVAHGFVKVHAVEDRRVVSGEQLIGDDEDLRVLAWPAKCFAQAGLFLLAQVMAFEVRRLVVPALMTTMAYLRRQ